MKQPISKLPFKHECSLSETINILGSNYTGSVGNINSKKDLEYIVEACNNYPKCIELLTECLIRMELSRISNDEDIVEQVNEFLNSIENEKYNNTKQ